MLVVHANKYYPGSMLCFAHHVTLHQLYITQMTNLYGRAASKQDMVSTKDFYGAAIKDMSIHTQQPKICKEVNENNF